MGWVSPTGFVAGAWANEPFAYDENAATSSDYNNAAGTWSVFITLTRAAINCDKVRFDAKRQLGYCELIDLDVYRNGGWVDVYEGDFSSHVWQEKTFTLGSVSELRIRFFNKSGITWQHKLYEVDFWESNPPVAPSNCVSSYVATNNAKCTWNDNSDNETGFRIEKDIDGAGFSFWKNVGANVEDSGTYTLGANHRIRFRVRAYNDAGDSGWSTSGYTYTTPTAPSGINLSWLTQDETVRIQWTDNSAYEQDFDIERNTDGGGFGHIVYDVASPYDDTGPSGDNHNYQYRVRARCPDGRLSGWNTSGYIYSSVSKERNIVYDTIAYIARERNIVYDLSIFVDKERNILYDSVLELSGTRNIVYDLVLELSKTRNIIYDSVLELSKERSIVYDLLLELSKERNIQYSSVLEVSKERSILYDLFELIQRLERPTGVCQRLDRPTDKAVRVNAPTGDSTRQNRPSDVPVRMEKPTGDYTRVGKPFN